MNRGKTDNTHFDAKVRLRMEYLPDSNPVRVLDCFGGEGRIWQEIKRRLPDRQIQVSRMDARKDLPGVYLEGDNRKYLAGLNIDAYDVIDLDAYGVPFEQLEILFSKPCRQPKAVFVTFIQTWMKQLPYGMLERLGYPHKMARKCPILFGRNGFEKLKGYLSLRGVREIDVVGLRDGSNPKSYLHFELPALS